MQTHTITTYSFDELPIETQEKIAESWRNNDDFPWGDEWVDSLNEFCEYFGLKINHWSGDAEAGKMAHSDISGARLYEMLINRYGMHDMKDCPFTGYFGDESLLEPMRDFIKKPNKNISFYELINECFDNWTKEHQKDIEYWESFDGIKEEILTHDYQFKADGDLLIGVYYEKLD